MSFRSCTGRALMLTLVAVALFSSTAGCGSSAVKHGGVTPTFPTAPPTTPPAASTTQASTTTQPTATTTANAVTAAFTYSVSTVSAADLPHSWHPGCPIGPAQLRMIHLSYWGFDSRAHTGEIVVNEVVATQVVGIFEKLYNARFAIYEMVPVDAYGGDDNRAAAADDTSGFNCRYAVTNPPSQQWSVHAYGEAIDVNDVQNPYVDGSTIIPPAGAAYLNRSDVRPGMAEPGGVLVDAFGAAGWFWGGRWNPGTDYQHFSKTGG